MQDDTIDIHIRSAARPGIETERLLDQLTAWCWPNGTHDHSNTIARGWLRQYGCVRPMIYVPTCTCEHGHCMTCN